jgi:hypothetical protein
MADPNLPLLEDAVRKLAPFLDEIVFVGGVTLGLLITDQATATIRGTIDVDVIAEIVTYADYIAFSERLRQAQLESSGPSTTTRKRSSTATSASSRRSIPSSSKSRYGSTTGWLSTTTANWTRCRRRTQ